MKVTASNAIYSVAGTFWYQRRNLVTGEIRPQGPFDTHEQAEASIAQDATMDTVAHDPRNPSTRDPVPPTVQLAADLERRQAALVELIMTELSNDGAVWMSHPIPTHVHIAGTLDVTRLARSILSHGLSGP